MIRRIAIGSLTAVAIAVVAAAVASQDGGRKPEFLMRGDKMLGAFGDRCLQRSALRRDGTRGLSEVPLVR